MMRETLSEICTLLNKHDVDYLLIGGVAVVYHGYTRSTADLDFWYKPTLSNFHNIIKAFKDYGIDVSDLEKIVFESPKDIPSISHCWRESGISAGYSWRLFL